MSDNESMPMIVSDNLSQNQDMMLLSMEKDGYISGDFGED